MTGSPSSPVRSTRCGYSSLRFHALSMSRWTNHASRRSRGPPSGRSRSERGASDLFGPSPYLGLRILAVRVERITEQAADAQPFRVGKVAVSQCIEECADACRLRRELVFVRQIGAADDQTHP